jgi:hypothetical protein
MKNKIAMAAMISLLLVFGLIFVSCGGEEETDSWSAVTNVNDLAGTWKGSTTISVPKQTIDIEFTEPIEMPATTFDVALTFVYGGSWAAVTYVIDIGKLLDALTNNNAELKNLFWEFISEGSGEKYKITETETVPKDDILSTFTEDGASIQINQDGNKVKLSLSAKDALGDEDFDIDLGGDTIEITLSKQ